MRTPEMNETPTVALRRLHRWRMAFSGLVILIAGITIGGAGAVVFIRPAERQPPPDMERAVAGMVGWFRQELSLSQEQMAEIEAILRLRMGNLEQLRREARPKIDEQLQAMKYEIDDVLTEEQRNHWLRITERLEREFHRGMRRGGPGRPGPGPRDDFRGERRPERFDPNGLRRIPDGRDDPNAVLRRGGPRPDWQGLDGERMPFNWGDRESRMPEPNSGRWPEFGYFPSNFNGR